jgi:hypothetical protein
MTLVMPYKKISQIVSGSQLISTNEIPIFLKATNYACLILGIITFLAIIPVLLGSQREKTTVKISKS